MSLTLNLPRWGEVPMEVSGRQWELETDAQLARGSVASKPSESWVLSENCPSSSVDDSSEIYSSGGELIDNCLNQSNEICSFVEDIKGFGLDLGAVTVGIPPLTFTPRSPMLTPLDAVKSIEDVLADRKTFALASPTLQLVALPRNPNVNVSKLVQFPYQLPFPQFPEQQDGLVAVIKKEETEIYDVEMLLPPSLADLMCSECEVLERVVQSSGQDQKEAADEPVYVKPGPVDEIKSPVSVSQGIRSSSENFLQVLADHASGIQTRRSKRTAAGSVKREDGFYTDDEDYSPEGEMNSAADRSAAAPIASELITYDVLARYFDKPMDEAALELGVGSTTLKKICRKYDIHRWPQRNRKSLRALAKELLSADALHYVTEAERDQGLDEIRLCMTRSYPSEFIKKLRQKIFKAKHVMKKSMRHA